MSAASPSVSQMDPSASPSLSQSPALNSNTSSLQPYPLRSRSMKHTIISTFGENERECLKSPRVVTSPEPASYNPNPNSTFPSIRLGTMPKSQKRSTSVPVGPSCTKYSVMDSWTKLAKRDPRPAAATSKRFSNARLMHGGIFMGTAEESGPDPCTFDPVSSLDTKLGVIMPKRKEHTMAPSPGPGDYTLPPATRVSEEGRCSPAFKSKVIRFRPSRLVAGHVLNGDASTSVDPKYEVDTHLEKERERKTRSPSPSFKPRAVPLPSSQTGMLYKGVPMPVGRTPTAVGPASYNTPSSFVTKSFNKRISCAAV
eukprot:NODE_3920_length_1141_cov_19.593320_g3730_i0.p1 GENE.NODE_3920_length_1141_cov_19.593320_g3730_i0~~NODE_3920_length_1141_cov_19.593320_g3730_i0.p1  ORF type:complete len:312 (+),score=50.26 NODE_3920_length_1141_cov_19.593320_g3730_i0:172-1107(+)